jgi:hypothetical protein
MDALLRSFVTKVHRHVTTTPPAADGNDPAAIQCILSAVTPDASQDVVATVFETVCHDLRGNKEALHSRGGLQQVLRYMIAVQPTAVEPCVALHACTIVACSDTETVAREVAGTPDAVGCLFEWFLVCSDVRLTFSLTLLLCLDDTMRQQLVRIDPVAVLSSLVTTPVLEDAALGGLVMRTFIELCRGAPELFRRFWRLCGAELLEREAMESNDLRVLDTVYELVSSLDPPGEGLVLPRASRVPAALAAAVRDVATGLSWVVLMLYRNSTLAARLMGDTEFMHAFLCKIVEDLQAVPGDDASAALELVTRHLSPDLRVRRTLLHTLYAVEHPPTEAQRALVLVLGLDTAAVVPCFGALKAHVVGTEVAVCSTTRQLDAALCGHFNAMVQTPALPIAPLRLDGTIPQGALFHVVQMVTGEWPDLGSDAAAAVTESCVATVVADYVCERIETARAEAAITVGTETYCRQLVSAYGLQARCALRRSSRLLDGSQTSVPAMALRACVPSCPISLEAMHAPVVASDGRTYELGYVVQLVRCNKELLSPLTRERLGSSVVYNWALHETAIGVWAAAESILVLPRAYRRRLSTPIRHMDEGMV